MEDVEDTRAICEPCKTDGTRAVAVDDIAVGLLSEHMPVGTGQKQRGEVAKEDYSEVIAVCKGYVYC